MDSNALVPNRRKTNPPKRFQRIIEQCSGARICDNSACRAVVSFSKKFCTRCSCCICKEYDGNKDPSLWLECISDSSVRSCGLSCHIKCALEHGKVGVVNICQMMRLDGGYWCSYCGHISEILGCLKNQLTAAKDSQRVAILCYRIDLSFKLLDGTSRFEDLFKIIKAAKSTLESEVVPLGGLSSKMACGLVSLLSVAAEVHALCTAAIQKADELSVTCSTASLENWALVVVPDEELPAGNVQAEVAREKPARAEAYGDLNGNFEQGPDEEMPAVGFQDEVAREVYDDLGDNFEYCLEVIQGLVRDNHLTSEVREKLFTWLSLRSDEYQRIVVYTFIQLFGEDSRGLAQQLVDTFGDVI